MKLTDTEIDTLTGRALDEALAQAMEPRPADVSARELREREERWVWVSYHDYQSEGGWWAAEIGTDHNCGGRSDDDPVQWRPRYSVGDDTLEDAETALRIMADDRWPVDWALAKVTYDMEHVGWYVPGCEQMAGTAALAIARAFLKAVREATP